MSIDEGACQAAPWGKSCGNGEWCCLDASDAAHPKSVCMPCEHTFFGHCLYETSSEVCARHNLKPWNSLSDLQDLVKSEGEELLKEAAKQLLCRYVPSQCS